MEDRAHGRSRSIGNRRTKSRRQVGKQRKGCLGLLTGILIFAIVAAAVFFYGVYVREEKPSGTQPQTAEQPGTIVFPGDSPETITAEETAPLPEKQDPEQAAETVLKSMSTEEKVLQLFMITPEALVEMGEVYAAGDKTREAINLYPVGGIVYFKQNLKSPEQVTDMLKKTRQFSVERTGVPMLLAVDEEGGEVSRIGGREEFRIPAIPKLSEAGASGDPKKAYEIGNQIGTYLSNLGFNMDFAPVADVLTNQENQVVANRSFGSDGAIVSEFVKQEIKGLKSHGIIPVLKHFPGHGGTAGDTHEGYAYTERTLEQLMAEELVPFKDGIDEGIDVIMAGHISAPAVTGDNTPASLSAVMINDILRGQLGFDKVVITDALNMGAITTQYTSSQAAVKSLQAGVDILLMPADFKEAYNGVLDAVNNGTISEERLNQSVRRILTLKAGL